jgi:2-keto-4-pentenoate hydratase/2-oxohepta-3-ene-1,7-dioic acid hydratase in catechol pathway
MKICRFVTPENPSPQWAIIRGDELLPIDDPFHITITPSARSIPLSDAQLVAPAQPSKIVCVGRNYRDHAAELGNPMPPEPLLFLKPPSAIIGPDQEIQLPAESDRVEYEGEIAVVIGRKARRLASNPLDYVLGYTCLNDVTARDLQRRDAQWTRAKSFDTFCPIGPVIETDLDPSTLIVETRLNGQLRQRGAAAEMAFPIPFLIRYISHIMTLEPGDVIATGTPAGVGPLAPGDAVEISIPGIGTLRNTVRPQSPP